MIYECIEGYCRSKLSCARNSAPADHPPPHVPVQCLVRPISWKVYAHVMHGSVHPREVGAPHGPRVARDGVLKKQLLDHDIVRLAGCVPQPPDSVPPHMSV